MTSNVVTIPHKAPKEREVPEFKPSIKGDATDDDRSNKVLGDRQFLELHANRLASLEGNRAAVGALLDIIEELQRREISK